MSDLTELYEVFAGSESLREDAKELAEQISRAWEVFAGIAKMATGQQAVVLTGPSGVYACNGTALKGSGVQDSHDVDVDELQAHRRSLFFEIGHSRVVVVGDRPERLAATSA